MLRCLETCGVGADYLLLMARVYLCQSGNYKMFCGQSDYRGKLGVVTFVTFMYQLLTKFCHAGIVLNLNLKINAFSLFICLLEYHNKKIIK